jgi:hypothetical protein
MTVPNQAVLQQGVDRHLTLTAEGDSAAGLPLQDAVCALCVLTGARTVEAAMTTVHRPCPDPMTPGPPRQQALTVPEGGSVSEGRRAVS